MDAKEKALTSHDSGHQIVAQATVGISTAVAAKLPQLSSWKRSLRRARQTADVALPNPQSLTELQIPREIYILDDGEDFLKSVSDAVDDRIVIFSTDCNLRLLVQSPNRHCDGTFSIQTQHSEVAFCPPFACLQCKGWPIAMTLSVCLSVCPHKTRNCEETERRTKKVLEIKVVGYGDSYSGVSSVVTSHDL
jgi:hypothetical protein